MARRTHPLGAFGDVLLTHVLSFGIPWYPRCVSDWSTPMTALSGSRRPHLRSITALLLSGIWSLWGGDASGTVIFGNMGLNNGSRWDAAPRVIGGFQRSLADGLRYSLEGASYQAYRDMFTWDVLPSLPAFQAAVESAFAAWTVTDPATGLPGTFSFVADFLTPVAGPAPTVNVNAAGAEIDLLTEIDAVLWDPGDPNQRAETFFDTVAFGSVTLTSGTPNYPGFAISGADIKINNNPQAVYNLPFFQLLLTHEIGHALGLGDVDTDINFGLFIDDNFDGTTSATALATLTNPWAQLVNPINPAASPLALFNVADGNPGVDTPGVDILMETNIPGALEGDPTPLQNDDFGGRQFLYPVVVPQAPSLLLMGSGLAAVSHVVWRRARRGSISG